MGEKIKITYETLFDILRNEKNRNELQRLEETFFEDLVKYISEKKKLINKSDSSVFADAEQRKAKNQLESIFKLVKQLYDQREKKIVNMAIISVKTGEMLDRRALLKQEKLLFDSLVEQLKSGREGILKKVLNTKQPKIKLQPNQNTETPKNQSNKPSKPKKSQKSKNSQKLIRFLKPVPKFVGKQLEVYGPFEEEDVANLPVELADVLISKSRAEEIKS
ncbi:MAG: hypothetical protein MAG795_00969 [Candidatus Woesearchaeota archaeon]|nr:hypothetical protein [Candidatus Woesearchaeota archaeon]